MDVTASALLTVFGDGGCTDSSHWTKLICLSKASFSSKALNKQMLLVGSTREYLDLLQKNARTIKWHTSAIKSIDLEVVASF